MTIPAKVDKQGEGINPKMTLPKVQNSDASYEERQTGGILALPDINIIKNDNSIITSPSVKDLDLRIIDPCESPYSGEATNTINNIQSNGGILTSKEKYFIGVWVDRMVTNGDWAKVKRLSPVQFAAALCSRTCWKTGVLMTVSGDSVVHDGQKYTIGGTDDYIDTLHNPSTDGADNDFTHIYQGDESGGRHGCDDGTNSHYMTSDLSEFKANNIITTIPAITRLYRRKCMLSWGYNGTNGKVYRNAVDETDVITGTPARPNRSIYLGGVNTSGGSINDFTGDVYMFAVTTELIDFQDFYAGFEEFRTSLHPEILYKVDAFSQGSSFRDFDAQWIWENYYSHFNTAKQFWNGVEPVLDGDDRYLLLNKNKIAENWGANREEIANTYRADFNGISSEIVITDHADFDFGDGAGNDNEKTVTFFFNADVLSGGQGLVTAWDGTTDWLLYLTGTSLSLIIDPYTGTNKTLTLTNIEVNKDYFVCLSYNGVPTDTGNFNSGSGDHAIKLWIYNITDGFVHQEQITTLITPSIAGFKQVSTDIKIGSYSSNYFDGEIWDVRFYSSDLNTNAQDLEKAYQGKVVSSCFARYEMNGGANDTSGSANNHNGTASNVTFNSATQVTRKAIMSYGRFTTESGSLYPYRYRIDHYTAIGWLVNYLIHNNLSWNAAIDLAGTLFGGTGTDFGYPDWFLPPIQLQVRDLWGSNINQNIDGYFNTPITNIFSSNPQWTSTTELDLTTRAFTTIKDPTTGEAKTTLLFANWCRKHY